MGLLTSTLAQADIAQSENYANWAFPSVSGVHHSVYSSPFGVYWEGAGPVASDADVVLMTPIWVPPTGMDIDRVGIRVTTGEAATNAYVGVYGTDTITGLPAARLTSAGAELDCATSGLKENTVALHIARPSAQFPYVWGAVNLEGFTTGRVLAMTSPTMGLLPVANLATGAYSYSVGCYLETPYAQLPADASAASVDEGAAFSFPLVFVRIV